MPKRTHNSFNKKLRYYTLCLSLFSLLIVGCGVIAYDFYAAKNRLHKELDFKADLIIQQYIQGVKAKRQTLPIFEVLALDPMIKGIWVFDRDGNTSIAYDPYQNSANLNFQHEMLNTGFFDTQTAVLKSFQLPSGLKGSVFIVSSGQDIYLSTLHAVNLFLVLGAIGLFFTWIISFKFQIFITKPFNYILHTVERITRDKDYSIRLLADSNDDFSRLSCAFNNMLEEVMRQEKALKESEARLNLALWGSNEVMLDWDLVTDNWFFDESFESLLGYAREDTPTTRARYFNLIHIEDLKAVNQQLQTHIAGKSPYFEVEHRLRHQLGHWVWILARAKVVHRTHRGRATRIVGTFVDITERKLAEDRFKLFHKIFESTNEGVFVVDPNLKIIEVNPAFSRVTGYLRREAIGKSLDKLHADSTISEHYGQILSVMKEKGYWQGEIWEKRKNGEAYPQRLTLNKMLDEHAQVIHFVGVFSDITKDKETEDELAYLTHYDPLTGLPNRTLFMAQLESSISTAKSNDEKVALAIVGLDNFKIINDSLGHVVGDVLLQNVSARLSQVVSNESAIARITGDEFAIIIQNVDEQDSIKDVGNTVLQTLSSCFVIDGHDIFLSASIGVSLFPMSAATANDLLLQADTAMYHAKQSGGNMVKRFTPEMNDKVQQRQRMETLLRSALIHDEFHLLYQPKIDALSGKIVGAEALIRWESPELGLVPPNQFIGLAENIGAIVPIGKWVLRSACAQTSQWHQMGFNDFKVAVNISACQFKSQDMATDIARILWETNLEPEALDLELTESLLMENAERCILMLKVLKSMGITISVDDFGTGYSSLSYLRRFPIDAIKIDRSFVQNVLSNHEDASIVRAIVAMAKGLKLLTLAEGVEEKEQVEFLAHQVGVEQFQGFYFSRPVTAETLTKMLQKQDSQSNSSQHFGA